MVTDALNPLLELLGKTLLTTPEPSSLPSIGQLWTESWHILLAVYVLIVLVAGIIVMGYETLQTRYTIKEIAPRAVIGFLAGTLSLFLATKAIQIANALARAVIGEGVSPQAAGKALADMVLGALDGGGLWLIFIGFALAVMTIVLLLTFIVRVMVTILLIAAAPIALMWHALPHTEGIAQAWWKAVGGVLAVQVGQSLAMVVALRIFFVPGGFTVFGPNLNGLINLLLCLALMWILIKIPFWCLRPLSGGRRSILGSLVRGAIAYKTMGLLGGPAPCSAAKAAKAVAVPVAGAAVALPRTRRPRGRASSCCRCGSAASGPGRAAPRASASCLTPEQARTADPVQGRCHCSPPAVPGTSGQCRRTRAPYRQTTCPVRCRAISSGCRSPPAASRIASGAGRWPTTSPSDTA